MRTFIQLLKIILSMSAGVFSVIWMLITIMVEIIIPTFFSPMRSTDSVINLIKRYLHAAFSWNVQKEIVLDSLWVSIVTTFIVTILLALILIFNFA